MVPPLFPPCRRDQEYIVPPVAGPLTHTLATLEYYMDSSLGASPWNADPRIFPIPWRKELAAPPQRPLKLAFIFDDGFVKPQPPVARAIREAADKLKAAGHEGKLFTRSSREAVRPDAERSVC